MGYAIFTARKLMLTNRINQLNFRIMQLSQQQQTLVDQETKCQMAMGNIRNMFSSIGGMMNMSLGVLQQRATANGWQSAQDGTALNAQALLAQQAPFVAAQQGVSTIFGMIQQNLDYQNQAQMKQIKEMENNIQLQQKALETQLAAATKELEKVEQAEEKQIERSAPKFA